MTNCCPMFLKSPSIHGLVTDNKTDPQICIRMFRSAAMLMGAMQFIYIASQIARYIHSKC